MAYVNTVMNVCVVLKAEDLYVSLSVQSVILNCVVQSVFR